MKRSTKKRVEARARDLEVKIDDFAFEGGGTLYAYAPKGHVFTATGTHLVVAGWLEGPGEKAGA